MEALIPVSHRKSICPILCVLKAALITAVGISLVFVPLGDPNIHCQTLTSPQTLRAAKCHLCEAYFLFVNAVRKASDTLKYLICLLLDLLYVLKLKFYGLLETIDRDDLCSTVCCTVYEDPNNGMSGEPRCPFCNCCRRRCRNRNCRNLLR